MGYFPNNLKSRLVFFPHLFIAEYEVDIWMTICLNEDRLRTGGDLHEEGYGGDCIAVAVASIMKMIVIAIADLKLYF